MKLNPIRKLRKLVYRSFLYRWYAERVLRQQPFLFEGRNLNYVLHPHNFTWTNERAVELALTQDALSRETSGRILEVGNVTRHYFQTTHDVVDKYEKAPGILNVDIVEYSPKEKYDFVFAISTLEHVGWDRDQREKDKIPIAVEKLKSLLSPGGRLFVTVPIGFNSFLDEFLETNHLGFDEQKFLKRTSAVNEWQEADWNSVRGTRYNQPFNNANAIAVLRYTRP